MTSIYMYVRQFVNIHTCRLNITATAKIPGRETVLRDIPGKTGIVGRYARCVTLCPLYCKSLIDLKAFLKQL